MSYQKVFKSEFIKDLKNRILMKDKATLNLYEKLSFPILEDNCLVDARISVPDAVNLLMPDGTNLYNFENAKIIFEIYRDLPLVKASDPGLWTYLTHGPFWKYTKARWPIEKLGLEKDKSSYILEHWFVNKVGAQDLARNAISSLWWGCYLTFDPKRNNKYELTEQLFSMLDFYRTVIEGTQGRNREFTHAILEYIIENESLFIPNKEGKVRLLMRRANAVGGYKLLSTLTKMQIKNIFDTFRDEIKQFKQA